MLINHKITKRIILNRIFTFSVALTLALSCDFAVYADSSPPAKMQARASVNGEFVVRIAPGSSMGDVYGFGGSPKGPFARAEWHHFNGISYEKVREVATLNPFAPVDIEVTNLGTLVAIDNWHNLGIGSIFVIYGPLGNIIKQYTLLDLYSTADLKQLERTTSSIHWRCLGMTALESDTELWIDDSLGGRFVFQLDTGAFEYQRGAKQHGCG